MIFFFFSPKKLKLGIYFPNSDDDFLPSLDWLNDDFDVFDPSTEVVDQQPTQNIQNPLPPASPRTEAWGSKSYENTDNNSEEYEDVLGKIVKDCGIEGEAGGIKDLNRRDSGIDTGDEGDFEEDVMDEDDVANVDDVTDNTNVTDRYDVSDENVFTLEMNALLQAAEADDNQPQINIEKEPEFPKIDVKLLAPPDNEMKKRKSKTYQIKTGKQTWNL